MSASLSADQITRQSGSNFALAFWVLPKSKRDAITAVYAFCRAVDDAVDEPGDQDPKALLALWREEIAKVYDGKASWPLTQSLQKAVEEFDLTRAYFDGIITGCEMDLTTARYATFEALSEYCYHVAGEVGLLCMEIFGYRSERLKDYAVKLGMAFQLTNILRDVSTDARHGRFYLPQEDMARFGVSENQITEWADLRRTPCELREGDSPRVVRWEGSPGWTGFHNLMAFECQRARGFYRDALVLPQPQERPSITAAEIMRAVYGEILDRIERREYNVFRTRIRVPAPRKLWLAIGAWWENR